MTHINVYGGYELGDVAEKVAHWCVEKFDIDPTHIAISIRRKYKDCWGTCSETSIGKYKIMVVARQSLRDFVATVVHEMVHVKQWETEEWKGDGEREAERLQYKLTDELWQEDVL